MVNLLNPIKSHLLSLGMVGGELTRKLPEGITYLPIVVRGKMFILCELWPSSGKGSSAMIRIVRFPSEGFSLNSIGLTGTGSRADNRDYLFQKSMSEKRTYVP